MRALKARHLWKTAATLISVSVICGVLGSPQPLAEEASYRLGAGDVLRVTVFGHKDLSGEFEVGSTGDITLPLIGEVTVIDRTLRDVEKAVVEVLRPDYLKRPEVSVEVINYRPFYIIGEIRNPGSYPYVGGMRVVNAIAMAGGFTHRANETRLLITRARNEQVEGSATRNTPVFPGDVIEVPERFF
jgi:polysaccharide export outer membrane protein